MVYIQVLECRSWMHRRNFCSWKVDLRSRETFKWRLPDAERMVGKYSVHQILHERWLRSSVRSRHVQTKQSPCSSLCNVDGKSGHLQSNVYARHFQEAVSLDRIPGIFVEVSLQTHFLPQQQRRWKYFSSRKGRHDCLKNTCDNLAKCWDHHSFKSQGKRISVVHLFLNSTRMCSGWTQEERNRRTLL